MRKQYLGITACVIAVLVAGCGDGAATQIGGTDAPAATTTVAPTTVAPTTTGAPSAVTVVATDYAYEGLPASVPAGTSITLENASDVELHEFVALRLLDDETRSAEELMQLPPDQVAAFFPYMHTVIIAPPGQQGFPVEGTGVLTEPGRYLILCAIPTGAIPEDYLAAAAESEGGPPEVDGGPPHFVNGMFTEIVVEG